MPQSISSSASQSTTAVGQRGAAPADLQGEDKSWQDMANCLGVDPDLFFPERGASTREAKEVCKGCVVRDDCLEYALVNGEKFGIWGGLSEREGPGPRRGCRAGPHRNRLNRPAPVPAHRRSGRCASRCSMVVSIDRPSSSQRCRSTASSTARGARPTSSARAIAVEAATRS